MERIAALLQGIFHWTERGDLKDVFYNGKYLAIIDFVMHGIKLLVTEPGVFHLVKTEIKTTHRGFGGPLHTLTVSEIQTSFDRNDTEVWFWMVKNLSRFDRDLKSRKGFEKLSVDKSTFNQSRWINSPAARMTFLKAAWDFDPKSKEAKLFALLMATKDSNLSPDMKRMILSYL